MQFGQANKIKNTKPLNVPRKIIKLSCSACVCWCCLGNCRAYVETVTTSMARVTVHNLQRVCRIILQRSTRSDGRPCCLRKCRLCHPESPDGQSNHRAATLACNDSDRVQNCDKVYWPTRLCSKLTSRALGKGRRNMCIIKIIRNRPHYTVARLTYLETVLSINV